ncbi:MAG TPA: DUF4178 domain-containing protein [Lacunisphaera sp.]|jgi:hypothetical protein
MSNSNPTALNIGATGMLDGRRYTVRGRTVLSVVVDGETYYWNEFNLVDSSDNALTLVYEEAEDGPEWKVFKLFEPLRPISAAQAAAKCAGDWVDFGGVKAKVSLVDRSRIELTEGRVPDGVAIGVEANYFNAENGDRMIVVSWSGDELEYYEGGVTSARRIEAAFGLPPAEVAQRSFFGWTGGGHFPTHIVVVVVVAATALIGFFGHSAQHNSGSCFALPLPQKRVASVSPLSVGAMGVVAGKNFRVAAHALVEISRLGDRFDGHEYALTTPADDHALLVEALQGKSTDWYLLTPGVTPADLTPFQAASFRQDRLAIIGGRSMQVTQLFQLKVISRDGDDSIMPWPVGMAYGFLAKGDSVDVDGSQWLLVRWTETGIESYRVAIISDSDMIKGFSALKK